MLNYRKNSAVPLTASQVDDNFDYLMKFSNLLNSCSYFLSRETASLVNTDIADYVLSGVQSFTVFVNQTQCQCFYLQEGTFVDFVVVGSSTPEHLELVLVDENGSYFDFDINRADLIPIPSDCFLLVKMSDIQVTFTFSDVAINLVP